MTIRFDDLRGGDDDELMNSCHILEVEGGSPAQKGGLKPNQDYILGNGDVAFTGSDNNL